MLAAIEKYAPDAEVTIADQNEALPIEAGKHWLQVGTGWLENLEKFDVIIKSPGIPPNSQLKAQSSKLTTPTQIFFDTIKDSGALTIGITGSKGKSTTASLIYQILKAQSSKLKAHPLLVGNIGEPAITHINDAKKGTVFVMELSSYQLMDLTCSPHVAVITSFFPEHLDYHGSLENYIAAKKNITRHQTEDDYVFFADTVQAAEIAKEGDAIKIPFSHADAPVSIEETHLIGAHNLSNIAGAFMVATRLGISEKDAITAIKEFRGLPHRLQNLGEHHGAIWIDDAISTTPESTIAALDALGDDVKVIILGGQDRGYNFEALGQRIALSKIQTVILFPGSGPAIKRAIEEAHAKVTFFDADSMEQAVDIAKSRSPESPSPNLPIVLLSTASPSYGMFKNFEEKGEQFQKEIYKH